MADAPDAAAAPHEADDVERRPAGGLVYDQDS
jgi:hypothetical protein